MKKSDRLHQEATSLWIEVFGEAPAAELDGHQMLDVLLRNLEPKTYSRLRAAESARDLTWPRKSPS